MPTRAGLGQAAKSLSDFYNSSGVKNLAEEQLILVANGFLKYPTKSLLSQMGLLNTTQAPLDLLDLACGTGVVTQELQRTLSDDVLQQSKFLAADSFAAFVDLCGRRIATEKWVNAKAQVLDAMDTALPSSAFSHVAIAMGLHIIPRPDQVLKECTRILKPGGILGLSTSHDDETHSMWQPDIRSAFASFPFEAPFPNKFPTQMHDHGRWADPLWVESHLRGQGFKQVNAQVVRGTYRVESAENFLKTFDGMLNWVMNAWWSEQTRAAHSLDEVRELTRKHLEDKHGGGGWDIRWGIVVATGRAE